MTRTFSMACLVCLAYFTSVTVARADVPPAPGRKRVPMRYQVTSIPKGDMHLWAVPCGVGPDGEKNKWFEIKEGQPNSISRYASGDCDVFAISHERFVSRLTAREESGPNWVDDAKKASIRCEGMNGLYSQTELPSSDPRAFADVAFKVQLLDATQCKLAPVVEASQASAPASDGKAMEVSPGKSRCGCGLTRKADAFAPAVLAIGVLSMVRRRRGSTKAK